MTPAELVRETRLRKRLTQRRLAVRAGTSQSAIARIERGEEEVTWSRFRALMVSMGEDPAVTSEPLTSRYDAWGNQLVRAMSPTSRLKSGLASSRFASRLAVGVRAKTRARVR